MKAAEKQIAVSVFLLCGAFVLACWSMAWPGIWVGKAAWVALGFGVPGLVGGVLLAFQSKGK